MLLKTTDIKYDKEQRNPRTEYIQDGNALQLVQSFKDCTCSTIGGKNQPMIHKRAKKCCGENCIRYKRTR